MLDRTLVETLKYIQARDKLTNEQFAKKIGIHEVSWSRIRNYKKGIGEKTLRGLRQAYPELKEAIDCYLAGSTNHDVRPPEPFSGGLVGKAMNYIKRLIKGA